MDAMKAILDRLSLDTAQSRISDAEAEEWERRQDLRRKQESYRRQVPERYWSESIGTYRALTEEQKAAKEKAESFIRAVKCGKFETLVLLGGPGTGKTHLAAGILYECGGLYRMSSGICGEIRRAKSFGSSRTEEDIIGGYGSAGLLVIDEIGRGQSEDEEKYMLYQVINGRYNRRRPTVLASNLGKRDFLKYLGAASADRLSESAVALELSGQSYRAEIRRSSL